MSFQIKPRYGKMVVCDICGDFGVVGDWDWRHMRRQGHHGPIHLCKTCRPQASWCAAHQQYHLRASLHRRPCAECGGLFTAPVAQQLEHCPQCRRMQPAPTIARRTGLLGSLHTFFSGKQHGAHS